jgi:hypothetical protein
MLHERLDAINGALLDEVCREAWPESQTLDFKRILPTKDDAGRAAFLVDVCAMANSDGGDIVYGIADAQGTASAVMLLDPAVEAPDAAARRLGQLIEAWIEPRMPRPEFKPIGCTSGGYALVLRIPASYVGPHRVTLSDTNRFMLRSGSHNADMSYDQLRRAFDRTATLTERAQAFRSDRLEAIRKGQTWKPLLAGPVCVLQVIPLQAVSGRVQLDIAAAYKDYMDLGQSSWRTGMGRSTNLDGLIAYPPEVSVDGKGVLLGYTQLFRNGAIEAVWSGRVLQDDRPAIPSTTVSIFYRDGVRALLESLRRRGVSGPAIIAGAFLRVTGYEFAVDNRFFPFGSLSTATADRSDLLLPETWIDDVGTPPSDPDDIARPMLDVLWQAFGQLRCLEYDQQGRFIRGP